MRKTRWILLAIAAALLLAAIAAVLLAYRVYDAQAQQQALHSRYAGLRDQAHTATLTVTENGRSVGVYTLSALGVLDDTLQNIETLYTDYERMAPEDFSALPVWEKLAWRGLPHSETGTAPLVLEHFDAGAILRDLSKSPRSAAQDAFAVFDGGGYRIEPETQGNELREQTVRAALRESLQGAALTPDAPLTRSFELTDCDCYLPPELCAETADFDYNALLQEDAAGLEITIGFLGQTETLTIAPLLSADAQGRVLVDTAALNARLEAWAQAYNRSDAPYRFQSEVDGLTELDFLRCSYTLDQDALRQTLLAQLTQLDASPVTAPFLCTGSDGAPFAISGTYIAVSIASQKMSYYQNGELLVQTDVVTGKLDGHQTPRGYYKVQNKDDNCWLTGPDYCVFVKYWVGFYGAYGLHDASWRSNFGGDLYRYGGSHGCVNTPDEAMATIFEQVTIGTPVLVY